jgi:hypothetical protein
MHDQTTQNQPSRDDARHSEFFSLSRLFSHQCNTWRMRACSQIFVLSLCNRRACSVASSLRIRAKLSAKWRRQKAGSKRCDSASGASACQSQSAMSRCDRWTVVIDFVQCQGPAGLLRPAAHMGPQRTAGWVQPVWPRVGGKAKRLTLPCREGVCLGASL